MFSKSTITGAVPLLVVLFENSIAAAPAIAGGLDPAQVAAMLDRLHNGAVSALEPLSILGDISVALLGIAATRAGAPRWAAVIAIGALGEGVGFAAGMKALVIISFALMFAGLLSVVRMLAALRAPRLAAEQPGHLSLLSPSVCPAAWPQPGRRSLWPVQARRRWCGAWYAGIPTARPWPGVSAAAWQPSRGVRGCKRVLYGVVCRTSGRSWTGTPPGT